MIVSKIHVMRFLTVGILGMFSVPGSLRAMPAADVNSPFIQLLSLLDAQFNVSDYLEHTGHLPVVSNQNIYALYKKGAALFVDARSPEEFSDSHIPGAINLPFDRLSFAPFDSLITALDKHQLTIVYCWNWQCSVSHICAQALVDSGLKRVAVGEGFTAWNENSFPITSRDREKKSKN